MQVLLVGCGSISIQELKGLTTHPDARVAALVDIRPENAKARQAEFGLSDAEVSTDLDAMLAKHRPDLVVDCTLPATHSGIAQKAIAAGAHVLGQKPMADTLAAAREAVRAAHASDRTYGVIQTMRFAAVSRALRDFVASGAIGEVTTVDHRFFNGMHFPDGDFRHTMEHVLILDMAIHSFDLARFITGKDARSALCREWNPPGSWYARDAAAFAWFTMDDGVRFVYHGSWASEGLTAAEWRITGTEGSVVAAGGAIRAERVTGPGGFHSEVEEIEVPAPRLSEQEKAHVGAVHDFINAIRDGREPISPCTDNFRSLAMVHAAIASSETGRETDVEEL